MRPVQDVDLGTPSQSQMGQKYTPTWTNKSLPMLNKFSGCCHSFFSKITSSAKKLHKQEKIKRRAFLYEMACGA